LRIQSQHEEFNDIEVKQYPVIVGSNILYTISVGKYIHVVEYCHEYSSCHVFNMVGVMTVQLSKSNEINHIHAVVTHVICIVEVNGIFHVFGVADNRQEGISS
jgi:bifunctional N-acetylglucosamine-1-phosphate-uridyltransferase/glucosamine-1-phosphate-acetyltransferase GlmU-like protein